ncbi:ABC-F family ATP-binding cassette domain-containing protein [Parasegetibacter sp. NRK P23]|uniref:ABC-F family ATP-binding cassette domain-containing protein n=1 Tax=Parasegetibacter sp. NRK P23 TaxID=2942999 RepID=UPI0020448B80|nr:ABC-F family ATP-binding cassette domain-containing protein [Parasegetibacter sp. NRK P23]MCM5528585.1 ABC-F family ATP-binding cassette domain-containing protein [Parasegetibacter sp. NRK P23]
MLIGLQDVTFEFGARTIVRDATWHLNPGERIGLIGYNGTGKSTLLKVLVGEYTPSAGSVVKSKETTIGYLHQDLLSFDTNNNITQVAMEAFEKVMALQKEQHELEKLLEAKEDEKLLNRYMDVLHEIDLLDGYNVQHKAEEVLHGLGFSDTDLVRPYKEFSGGWRMRVLLAKMILQQPDVLLLDEPTNHLDLPSIEWLEKYLLNYKGSVVIVSHDKFFLDKMVNKIVELYQQELHIYVGNYSYYETEKEVRVEMQKRAYENQQDFIRQQERFIERFKAKASKAAQAQSVQKRLDKIDRIEDVEIERPNMRINFSVGKEPGKIICTLKNVSKSFGDLQILKNASGEIERGDKIALIGANGKGKSTLLRIVAGTEPIEGERIWGHNVAESFYAQHQLESLGLNNTLIEEMNSSRAGKTELEYRSLLGAFLFGGDDVDKRIKILSGGEKARVALAKVIVSKANFLMLDEPTNHLDIHSVELLVEALNKYEGSIILVSHDRYFISKAANKIWEIVDGKIKEFKGTYHEWVEWKERMAARAIEEAPKKEEKEKEKSKPAPVAPQPQAKQGNAPINKELQKLQKTFQQLEEKIAAKKAEKEKLEAALGNPDTYSDPKKFQDTEKSYKAVGAELEQMNVQYEELFEQIMALDR